MKTLLLALALLSAATLLALQQESQPGTTPTDKPLSQQTVQGCLQGGDHQFTLTDSRGTTYRLEGDSAKLKEHVGHEIEVAGTIGRGSASSSKSAPPDDSQSTIQVVDVKHLSGRCRSGK